MTTDLRKRIEALETRLPPPVSEWDELLLNCTDDELRRIISITEKDESSPEDIEYMANLGRKYAPT